MAITKYIIDQMGGTIEVKSEQNKGSEFHVALDLKTAEDGASEQELGGKRVLFADGDSRVCQSAAELLASMGAKADWTADGREAIGMVERSCEEGRSYDVILLGWNLMEPDGKRRAGSPGFCLRLERGRGKGEGSRCRRLYQEAPVPVGAFCRNSPAF